ncbi:MAG: DUF4302 domain-containing protein [Bacteroidota bacterium]
MIPTLLLSSCKKEDIRVFEKSSDERLSEALQRYNDVLTSAPYGWKTIIYPSAGGYAFYFEFKKDGTVTSFSDINLKAAGTPLKSTYRLKALQQPSLLFDTYTYLHLLSDPDGRVNGGNDGEGLLSDFEFMIDSVSTNTIHLKGTVHGSVVQLVSATQADQKSYYDGEVANSFSRTTAYLQTNQNPYLDLDRKLPVAIDIRQKVFTILSLKANGLVEEKSVLFTFTSTGIIFKEPITVGNLTFQELLWDTNEKNYYVLVGGKKIFLKNGSEPVTLVEGGIFENFLLPEGAIDSTNAIPGQSDEFLMAYKEIKKRLLASRYKLTLTFMYFRFNNATTLDLIVGVFQINPTTGNREDFTAVFPYTVKRAANGNTTFSLRAAPSGNAGLIVNEMAPFLDYLTTDTFRFEQQFSGAVGRMGRMNNITRTEFFFTGAIYLLQ